MYGKMLAHIAIHLVHKEYHGKIERQEAVAEVGYAIEASRVGSTEMNGYDIALTLHALLDKRLCPRYIVYRTVGLATTIKPSWEHQHMIVALEASLNHTRKVATVASCLVDTYAIGSKTRQVHKQIVD